MATISPGATGTCGALFAQCWFHGLCGPTKVQLPIPSGLRLSLQTSLQVCSLLEAMVGAQVLAAKSNRCSQAFELGEAMLDLGGHVQTRGFNLVVSRMLAALPSFALKFSDV
jgi:hypothetical protein